MEIFKDSKGTVWEVRINLSSVMKIEEAHKINLYQGEQLVNGEHLYAALASDYMLAGKILSTLLSEQLESNGVSIDGMYELFDGVTLSAATEALFKELETFFLGLNRHDLINAVRKTQAAIAKAIETNNKLMDEVDVDKLVAEAEAEVVESLKKKRQQISGKKSGNTQESSA